MKNRLYILIVVITAFGCRKAYNPKPIAVASNYLVVEGIINTGQDTTIIRLSRTVPLPSASGTKPELGAIVTIMNDAGNSYTLVETGNGYYKTPGLNTVTPANYKLNISTAGGETYQSDPVPSKASPPIDSVYYRIESNGVQVYADTHDPANNTRYYRWDYTETYEYRSAFESVVYLSQIPIDTVLLRPLSDYVYECWRSDTSSSIVLNSSTKLAKDIIAHNPVAFVGSTSEKLEAIYSILVKQYALTSGAFTYFQQLKTNTEQLGSIFDPQPSELPGNIHCTTNPGEPVIGYITAGTASEARLFITNQVLPAWHAITPYDECKMDTDLFAGVLPNGLPVNQVLLNIYEGPDVPIYPILPPSGQPILGYAASSNSCIDCTLRGTNVKPSYWINE